MATTRNDTLPRSSQRQQKGGAAPASAPASTPRSSKRAPVELGPLLPALRAALQDKGVLAARDLAPLGVPSKQRDEAVGLLVAEGFEPAGTGVRVPVAKQLRAALAQRRMVAADARKLAPLLSGVKPAELAPAVRALVSSGGACVVLRGKKQLYLAEPRFRLLSTAQIRALHEQASSLAELCKLALSEKPQPVSLFWSDVNEVLTALGSQIALAPVDVPAVSGEGERLGKVDVLDVVQAAIRPTLGLAFVPDIVRDLRAKASVAAIHEQLLALAQAGLLELRAEAGQGRFSSDELALCPPGPRGFSLVWARTKLEAKP